MTIQAKGALAAIKPYPNNPRLNDDAVDAVANGNVVELDDDIASRWGPRTPLLVQRRRAPGVVLRPRDGEEDLGRQHLEISGQHDRVAEVGEALDEAQQERVGQRGPQQRPGHRAEDAAARGVAERRLVSVSAAVLGVVALTGQRE